MNIVFFGTAEFAIPAFKALIASKHKVLALVTQPDRKRGRNLKIQPPLTKIVAETHGIPVYQPEDASSREAIEYLKKLGADLFVVIAFGQILKPEALSVPRLSAINLHGSLLPKYRGAAPTNWAIINGDKTSGVTIIRMNERMDEGDIILRREVMINEEDTNITLNETLSALGAKALIEAMELIESGRVVFKPQDKTLATLAPKLKKEDGIIDWGQPARIIHNRVRGLLPWPSAYTSASGKTLKILNTELTDYPARDGVKPGEVLDTIRGKGIVMNTGSGTIAIKYLQLEGGKVLDADSFLRGHRLHAGDIFI
ncbi:MAG: methionyl-tRNA formyltransferase [Candidatus Omnitrophica bacterium]|nr:methionyl-tRNA formyltransferase [Candidatus Omnitrophota bacterium]